MKMMKLRKGHCSPPLVGEDNSMVFTSHSVPFPATCDRRSRMAGKWLDEWLEMAPRTQNYVWIWRAQIWLLFWLEQAWTTWVLHKRVQIPFQETMALKWHAPLCPFGHQGLPKFKNLPAKFNRRFVCHEPSALGISTLLQCLRQS